MNSMLAKQPRNERKLMIERCATNFGLENILREVKQYNASILIQVWLSYFYYAGTVSSFNIIIDF